MAIELISIGTSFFNITNLIERDYETIHGERDRVPAVLLYSSNSFTAAPQYRNNFSFACISIITYLPSIRNRAKLTMSYYENR